jgi:hypothetical protein
MQLIGTIASNKAKTASANFFYVVDRVSNQTESVENEGKLAAARQTDVQNKTKQHLPANRNPPRGGGGLPSRDRENSSRP